MTTRRVLIVASAIVVLLACKSERKSKNDDIAACTASGGRWSEGGCSDNGHCEKASGMNGMTPDEDDAYDDDEIDEGTDAG